MAFLKKNLSAPESITSTRITANIKMSFFFSSSVSGEANLEFIAFAEDSQPEKQPSDVPPPPKQDSVPPQLSQPAQQLHSLPAQQPETSSTLT